MSKTTSKQRLVVVGPVPPPVHGASKVTGAAASKLSNEFPGDVVVIDTSGRSPRRTSNSCEGKEYLIRRALAHARACRALLVARLSGLRTTLYLGGAGGPGLWFQAVVVATASAMRVRVIFHHHSYAYLTSNSTPMYVISRMMGRYDKHLFLTRAMRSSFRRRYLGSSPAEVLSNANFVPVDNYGRGGNTARFELLHYSNLSVEKGTGSVLDVFEAAARSNLLGPMRLTLAGPCPSPELYERIRDLSSRSDKRSELRYLGALPESGVAECLREADVLLFLSNYRHEAEPLVVLESLAGGLPTVCTAVGSLPEFVPPDWIVDSADVMGTVLVLKKLRSSDRKIAAERAQRLFQDRQLENPIAVMLR